MKIYYAHHMWKYNTEEERMEIEAIKRIFPNSDIINPNGSVIETGNEAEAMEQCFNFIRESDILIFTTLSNKVFGRGVYDEVSLALKLGMKVFLLKKDTLLKINDINSICEIIIDKTKSNREYAKLLI
ncbi:hypothetical protein [Clostridium perfringens]|jgi:hypothetical protein|uniref:Uncharacterized protein n=1 Tax=Clostridium perfringens TaxID=1502 RepID=A0AAW4IZD4_CLOPF|nr:hypothetical protein [Clostridium perfringens]MBO3356284.1 hypothetical protein [Clostridium perfringens]MBO3359585.1 hypothetical protein [Clostridium perfringens]